MLYQKELCTITISELPELFSGYHQQYQEPFWRCEWITFSHGFRVEPDVTFREEDKKSLQRNPRHSGKWLFIVNGTLQNNIVATEYVRCNGKMNCLLDKGKCSVCLKLVYYTDHTCTVFSRTDTVSHGPDFQILLKSRRMTWKTKQKIRQLATATFPTLTPLQVQMNLVKENPGVIDPALVSHVSKISD